MNQREQNSVEWFEELESPLIAYAYGILQNREDACDQVQEAFHRFYSQDAIIKHPKAWLYRTLRNLCISQIRKQKRLQMEGEEKQLDFFPAEANPETAEGNPLEKLEKSEQILIMKHHLSLLPQEDLNLLILKFEKKMSYAQISEALGISSGNVGYKLHHLIRDLSESMKLEDIVG